MRLSRFMSILFLMAAFGVSLLGGGLIWFGEPAPAAPPNGQDEWEDLQHRLRTFRTAFIAIRFPDPGIGGPGTDQYQSWIIQVRNDGYIVADRHDGPRARLFHDARVTSLHDHITDLTDGGPVDLGDPLGIARDLFVEAKSGFARSTVEDRSPVDDGLFNASSAVIDSMEWRRISLPFDWSAHFYAYIGWIPGRPEQPKQILLASSQTAKFLPVPSLRGDRTANSRSKTYFFIEYIQWNVSLEDDAFARTNARPAVPPPVMRGHPPPTRRVPKHAMMGEVDVEQWQNYFDDLH